MSGNYTTFSQSQTFPTKLTLTFFSTTVNAFPEYSTSVTNVHAYHCKIKFGYCLTFAKSQDNKIL